MKALNVLQPQLFSKLPSGNLTSWHGHQRVYFSKLFFHKENCKALILCKWLSHYDLRQVKHKAMRIIQLTTSKWQITKLTTFGHQNLQPKQTQFRVLICKLCVQACCQYLHGDLIRSLIWQRISKELSIIRETSFSQCHSTIFRQFIGVQKYLCFTFQRVLDIQNTIMYWYINHTLIWLIKYLAKDKKTCILYIFSRVLEEIYNFVTLDSENASCSAFH